MPFYTLTIQFRRINPANGNLVGATLQQTYSVVKGSDVDAVKFGVSPALGSLLTGLTGTALYIWTQNTTTVATGGGSPLATYLYALGAVISAPAVGNQITIGADTYQLTSVAVSTAAGTLNVAYDANGTIQGFFASGTYTGTINGQDVNAISTTCWSSFHLLHP